MMKEKSQDLLDERYEQAAQTAKRSRRRMQTVKDAPDFFSAGNDDRLDYILERTIEDGLNEALGQSLSLATRVCPDTSVALNDPITYIVALEKLLGDRAARALSEMEKKLQSIGALRFAVVDDFDAIMYPKGLYSPETLARWR
jgi:hypothetical protein